VRSHDHPGEKEAVATTTRPAATVAVPANGPPELLALQRRAGNQAVLARLKINTGLRRKDRTDAFTKEAHDYWANPANKDKTLKDFSDFLIGKANAVLKAMGSYEVKPNYITTGNASGTFSRVTWAMDINTAKFSNRARVSKVSDLTLDEAAEIADTIYHEIRHSEQYFRIARVRAAESKKTGADIAKEIASDMSIPPAVAQAAAAVPMKAAKDNAYLRGEAKDWESITIGLHAEYKGIINTWIDEAWAARDAANAVDATNLNATKATISGHVSGWQTSNSRGKFVDSHLTKVEALATKGKMDKLVIKHLKAIKAALAKVNTAWKDVTDNWGTDDAAAKLRRLTAMRAPLRELGNAVYAAYRDHLHEKDAWETGAAVGKEFRRLGTP
jgi:predicted transglutaminase-like cysteine proteinase